MAKKSFISSAIEQARAGYELLKRRVEPGVSELKQRYQEIKAPVIKLAERGGIGPGVKAMTGFGKFMSDVQEAPGGFTPLNIKRRALQDIPRYREQIEQARTRFDEGIARVQATPAREFFLPTARESRKRAFTVGGQLLQRFPSTQLDISTPEIKEPAPGFLGEMQLQQQAKMELGSKITSWITSLPGKIIKDYGVTSEKIGKGEKLDFWDWLNVADFTPLPVVGLGTGLLMGGIKEIGEETTERAAREAMEELSGKVSKETLEEVAGKMKKEGLEELSQQKHIFNLNLNRLDLTPSERKTFVSTVEKIKPQLEKVKGRPLSHNEIVEASLKSDELQKVVTRGETKTAEAVMLKTRKKVVTLDKEIDRILKEGKIEGVEHRIRLMLDETRKVSATTSDWGRKLESLKIEAGDASIRQRVLADIAKISKDSDRITKMALDVDWNDANSITKFYRQFVEPTTKEIVAEYRYANMLANPRTQLKNSFVNLTETFVTRPAVLVAQGDVKGARQYYEGVFKNINSAVDDMADSFRGKVAAEKPELRRIATGKIPTWYSYGPRTMEALDVFFQRLIREGELARGQGLEEASATARRYLFRESLDPANKTGQGFFLSKIDEIGQWILQGRKKIPTMDWHIPFLQTPLQVAKQNLEFSPLGLATLPGSTRTKDQLAKTLIGSITMLLGAKMAIEGRTTWAPPRSEKEKQEFYAAGMKPYSIKIGNTWVPMIMFQPVVLALAIPAAYKYYSKDSKTALTDSQVEKITNTLLSQARMWSEQTFLSGLGNWVKLVTGDESRSTMANLGYTGSQIIPLSSLWRWVNQAIDPVYRKTKGFMDSVKQSIPGGTKGMEAYTDLAGEPSERLPVNILMPWAVGKDKPELRQNYERAILISQTNKALTEGKVPDLTNEINISLTAEHCFSEVGKGKTNQERVAAYRELKAGGMINEAVEARILIIQKLDRRGFTKTDRQLFLFTGRARGIRILKRLDDFTNEASKRKYYFRLKQAGLLDETTLKEIQSLTK